MVKNIKGGKKAKKQKNSMVIETDPNKTIEYKDDSGVQFYTQVEKVLGNSRFELFCEDGVTRIGHMRGKIKKKRCQINDLVLIALREFQTDDTKCDIIHKYTDDERLLLIEKGLVNTIVNKDKTITTNDVVFGDVNIEESKESSSDDITFEGI